jgi:hypothetical protein
MAGASELGEREVPRRDDDADAERDVGEAVVFALDACERLRRCVAQHLACVELAEVDGLGRVAVGLGPGLGDLVHHPRGEVVFALAQQRGHAEEDVCALLRERVAPSLEDLVGLLDGLRRQLLRRLVEAADNLRLACGVAALKQVARLYSLAADNERVLAPQLRADALQRLAHRARILFF